MTVTAGQPDVQAGPRRDQRQAVDRRHALVAGQARHRRRVVRRHRQAVPRIGVDRTMIQVHGLTKRFGRKVAVANLSFDVQPGRVTGFLGPNGSGKSTTMRCMLGLDRADTGGALFDGKPYASLTTPLARGRRAARRRLRASGPLGPQPPALDRRVERTAQVACRRGARNSGADVGRQQAVAHLLAGHAATPRAGRRAARRTATRSSSTNPPTASTPRASAGSATCWCTWPGRARPCSSAATCCRRWR